MVDLIPQTYKSPFEFKKTDISSPHDICLIENDVKLVTLIGLDTKGMLSLIPS